MKERLSKPTIDRDLKKECRHRITKNETILQNKRDDIARFIYDGIIKNNEVLNYTMDVNKNHMDDNREKDKDQDNDLFPLDEEDVVIDAFNMENFPNPKEKLE